MPGEPKRGSTQPADPQTQVLQQFRLVFNAVKAHWQQVERESGIGGAQVWALSVIRGRPGIGVNELAAALSVAQPTASYLARSLSQQGLIESRREGPDKRAVQLHVTPDGRQRLRRTPGPFEGVLPEALSRLDEALLLRLQADLAQLIAALKADPDAAELPMSGL